ncbi:MAG TPA: hypothetical protein DDW54_03055 [Clostridiales bacterium]|nr:hypothetical protein [Clostridiales bacterium]
MKKQGGLWEPNITAFGCTKKLFIYYFIRAAIWTAAFWIVADLRLFVRALDMVACLADFEGIDLLTRARLLAESALIIFLFFKFLFSVKDLYGVIVNIRRIGQTIRQIPVWAGCSLGIDGEQGVGKTRFMTFSLFVLSKAKLERMRLKYYLDCPIKSELEAKARNGDEFKWVKFKAREEAYNFYYNNEKNKDRLPGIYADYVVTYDGKKPYELKLEHFTMQEKIYESNVKGLAEADNVLPNTFRKVKPPAPETNKPEEDKKEKDDKNKKKKKEKPPADTRANDIDEYLGLDRQYTDGTLLVDTHANGSVFKSMRDTQRTVLHLERSEYRYTPKILLKWLDHLEKKVHKAGKRTSIRLRKRYLFVERLTKEMGITREYYTIGKEREEKFMVLPNEVPYAYDDTALKSKYRHAPKIRKDKEEKNA